MENNGGGKQIQSDKDDDKAGASSSTTNTNEAEEEEDGVPTITPASSSEHTDVGFESGSSGGKGTSSVMATLKVGEREGCRGSQRQEHLITTVGARMSIFRLHACYSLGYLG